jgi:hypothetical protein
MENERKIIDRVEEKNVMKFADGIDVTLKCNEIVTVLKMFKALLSLKYFGKFSKKCFESFFYETTEKKTRVKNLS